MYENIVEFVEMVENSVRTNIYSLNPYREIALVNVRIKIYGEEQICMLPFYRSSGTNSGKIKGEWYPLLGIKENDGIFDEFNSKAVNYLMNKITRTASRGWIAKSLFFVAPSKYKHEEFIPEEMYSLRGYSYTSHGYFLKDLASKIKKDFESSNTTRCRGMGTSEYNQLIYSDEKFYNNKISQKEIFDLIVYDIVNELRYID